MQLLGGDKVQLDYLKREYDHLLSLKEVAFESYQRLKAERRECVFALNTYHDISRQLVDVDFMRTQIILGIRAKPDESNRAFNSKLPTDKSKEVEKLIQQIWALKGRIETQKKMYSELWQELIDYKCKYVDIEYELTNAKRRLIRAGLAPIKNRKHKV